MKTFVVTESFLKYSSEALLNCSISTCEATDICNHDPCGTMILSCFQRCCFWINSTFCSLLWSFLKLFFLDCFCFYLILPQIILLLNGKGKLKKTSSEKQITRNQGTLPQWCLCESTQKSVLHITKQSIVAGTNDSVEAGSLVA